MTEVWLAEERHGYNYVFSSYDIALDWLKKELHDNDIDLDDPFVDYDKSETSVYVYYEGNLVACFERMVLDEID